MVNVSHWLSIGILLTIAQSTNDPWPLSMSGTLPSPAARHVAHPCAFLSRIGGKTERLQFKPHFSAAHVSRILSIAQAGAIFDRHLLLKCYDVYVCVVTVKVVAKKCDAAIKEPGIRITCLYAYARALHAHVHAKVQKSPKLLEYNSQYANKYTLYRWYMHVYIIHLLVHSSGKGPQSRMITGGIDRTLKWTVRASVCVSAHVSDCISVSVCVCACACACACSCAYAGTVVSAWFMEYDRNVFCVLSRISSLAMSAALHITPDRNRESEHISTWVPCAL